MWIALFLIGLWMQAPQEFYVEAMVDNRLPYVGQQITYTFQFYAASLPETILTLPDFVGFWHGDQLTTRTVELVEGRQYIVTRTTIVLYPVREGVLSITPTTLTIPETVLSDRPRIDLMTQSVAVVVRPLPENAPAGFHGAVGRMETKVEIDKQTVTLGEPLNLRYSLIGTGNIEILPVPRLPLPDGWRSYPNPSVLTTQSRGALLVAEKLFEWRLIPDKAGSHQFPAIVFSYFDPQVGAYRSVASEPFTVNVLPSESGLFELPNFEERVGVFSSLPLKTVELSNGTFFPPAGFWFLWLLPPFIVGGVWGLRNYRNSREQRRIQRRRDNAIHAARRRLEKALKMKPENACELVEDAITGYFGDKLSREIKRVEEIGDVMRAIHPELRNRVLACLRTAEDGRYTPTGVIDTESLIRETAETLRLVEQVW